VSCRDGSYSGLAEGAELEMEKDILSDYLIISAACKRAELPAAQDLNRHRICWDMTADRGGAADDVPAH